MLKKFLASFVVVVGIGSNLFAHCDIPCGIYDPFVAQNAALSVVRMADKIASLKDTKDAAYINSLTRFISVKETEAEKCKHEVRIIWGDFMKASHLKEYPELNTIVHNIMSYGGAAKQHVDRGSAMKLLNEVNKFAEIFWKIKGKKTQKIKAPYQPNEEIVYPILK